MVRERRCDQNSYISKQQSLERHDCALQIGTAGATMTDGPGVLRELKRFQHDGLHAEAMSRDSTSQVQHVIK